MRFLNGWFSIDAVDSEELVVWLGTRLRGIGARMLLVGGDVAAVVVVVAMDGGCV